MALLLVQVGLLLAVLLSTQACTKRDSCGCIVSDYTEISKHDYVFEPIRTDDFQQFLQRMWSAIQSHWLAYTFIKSFPDDPEPPEEIGKPICPTTQKHILGYFKNHGLTLCLVVKPHIQRVKKAECCSEEPPCGVHTRCVASGFEQRKYLVFCDAIYSDPDGCLVGRTELEDTEPPTIDDSDFDDGRRRKRTADEGYSNSTILDREQRQTCAPSRGYFAFRHDFLPSTCSARKCNC